MGHLREAAATAYTKHLQQEETKQEARRIEARNRAAEKLAEVLKTEIDPATIPVATTYPPSWRAFIEGLEFMIWFSPNDAKFNVYLIIRDTKKREIRQHIDSLADLGRALERYEGMV